MTIVPPETGSKYLKKSAVNHQDFIIKITTFQSSSDWISVSLLRVSSKTHIITARHCDIRLKDACCFVTTNKLKIKISLKYCLHVSILVDMKILYLAFPKGATNGLCRSAFSIYSFGKLVFCLSELSVFLFFWIECCFNICVII